MTKLKNELILSLMREQIRKEIQRSVGLNKVELNRLIDKIMKHIVQAANKLD